MGHVPRRPLLASRDWFTGARALRSFFFASRDWLTGGTWPAQRSLHSAQASVQGRSAGPRGQVTGLLGPLAPLGPLGSWGTGAGPGDGGWGGTGVLGWRRFRHRPCPGRAGWRRPTRWRARPLDARPAPVTPLHSIFRPVSTRSLAAAPGATWGPPTPGAFVVRGAALRQQTAERAPFSRSWELR